MKRDPDREKVASICKTLRATRIAQGISQQRLAEMAGISRTGLRHIESLETSPTLLSILRVARALDVDLGSLLESP